MKTRKKLLIAAKNELEDKERKVHPTLFRIKSISIDELSEIWPDWRMDDIIVEFLHVYFYIKNSKEEKAYIKTILKNSCVTKLIDAWAECGLLDFCESDRIVKKLVEEVVNW